MAKGKDYIPPIDKRPRELTELPEEDSDRSKKRPRLENKMDVPINSPTLTSAPEITERVTKLLENDKDREDLSHLFKDQIPGFKSIKPRPSFRLDDRDPKEKARDVYVFEFEDGNNVYMNKKDGSLFCAVDPKDEKAMGEAIDRMLTVANKMGMNNGMLCLPSSVPEGMRERLTERAKATAERLGMNIGIMFGDPRIPMPPQPQLGPSIPSPGPAMSTPGPAPVPPWIR